MHNITDPQTLQPHRNYLGRPAKPYGESNLSHLNDGVKGDSLASDGMAKILLDNFSCHYTDHQDFSSKANCALLCARISIPFLESLLRIYNSVSTCFHYLYLYRPHRITEMQNELAKVQQRYIWDTANNAGVFDVVLAELAQHSAQHIAAI